MPCGTASKRQMKQSQHVGVSFAHLFVLKIIMYTLHILPHLVTNLFTQEENLVVKGGGSVYDYYYYYC